MIDLSKFQVIPITDQTQRTPLLCVTGSTVAFGKGVLEALSSPRYAMLLINEETQTIILCECDGTQEGAFDFVKKQSDRYVRMKSRSLHNLCDKLANLTSDDYPYRVSGLIDSLTDGRPAVVFDMKKSRKTGE